MYEPPIEIFTHQIVNDVDRKIGEEVYRSVLKVGVKVDKEELIKALQYDRGQYSKGYADGVKEFAERLTDRICEKIERSMDNPGGDNYFITDVYTEIDDLKKEMVGDSK